MGCYFLEKWLLDAASCGNAAHYRLCVWGCQQWRPLSASMWLFAAASARSRPVRAASGRDCAARTATQTIETHLKGWGIEFYFLTAERPFSSQGGQDRDGFCSPAPRPSHWVKNYCSFLLHLQTPQCRFYHSKEKLILLWTVCAFEGGLAGHRNCWFAPHRPAERSRAGLAAAGQLQEEGSSLNCTLSSLMPCFSRHTSELLFINKCSRPEPSLWIPIRLLLCSACGQNSVSNPYFWSFEVKVTNQFHLMAFLTLHWITWGPYEIKIHLSAPAPLSGLQCVASLNCQDECRGVFAPISSLTLGFAKAALFPQRQWSCLEAKVTFRSAFWPCDQVLRMMKLKRRRVTSFLVCPAVLESSSFVCPTGQWSIYKCLRR